MSFLKKFDTFGSIHKEFTESTVHGGLLTCCAVASIMVLFFFELSAFMTTTMTSTVLLDRNFEDTVQIDFDITMLDLPCKYATVNIVDELGLRRLNVTSNIQKRIMHYQRGKLVPGDIHEDSEVELPEVEEIDRSLEVDDEGHHALRIHSEDEFNQQVKKHDMTFVNFYAPWCHWCQRLKPHWEAAATKFDKLKFQHRDLNVKFMSVDCDEFTSLCAKYQVRAFPALLRFRRSTPDFPFYDEGSRTEENLIAYFKKSVNEYETTMRNLYKFEACQLSGFVKVSRVPGNFFLEGQNPPGQNLSPSMTNTSHIIHKFRFGDDYSNRLEVMVPNDHRKLMSPLDGRSFVVDEFHTAPHHYLKVVSTMFASPALRGITFYEMTTQNRIATYQTDDTPSARFSYDLSPLAMTVGQKSTHWYDFMTGVFGIVGGTWTVIQMLDGFVFWSKEKVKVALGKKD